METIKEIGIIVFRSTNWEKNIKTESVATLYYVGQLIYLYPT
jgi:hypothetical protein